MTAGDVNGDKNNDLIIGSPYAFVGDSQIGFVSILFADKTSNIVYLKEKQFRCNIFYKTFFFNQRISSRNGSDQS